MNKKTDNLTASIELRDARINELEQVNCLEMDLDGLEQYSRRSNVQFCGTLRKKGKLTDTWTYNGKILVKDLQNKIALITKKSDLDQY